MTEFNYLVHGSLLFAAGLAIGLLGALLVTRRGRVVQKEVLREQTEDRELPDDDDAATDARIPTLDTPRAAAMPIPSLRPAQPAPATAEPASGLVAERPSRYDDDVIDPEMDSGRDSMAQRGTLREPADDYIREEPVLTNPRVESTREQIAEADTSTASAAVPATEDPNYADPEHVARTLRQALISGGKPKAAGAKSRPLDVDDDVGIS